MSEVMKDGVVKAAIFEIVHFNFNIFIVFAFSYFHIFLYFHIFTQPDTFINALLSTKIRQSVDIS